MARSIRPSVTVERCSICESTNFSDFAKCQHEGFDLSYKLCRYCGLVFMSPGFTEVELQDFYTNEYWNLYGENAKPKEMLLRDQEARAEHLAKFLAESVSGIHSHLDIGCSTGGLMLAMRRTFPRVETVGIELSKDHRAWCGRQGLTVYPSLAALQRAIKHRFGLVSLSHVLEHVAHPIELLMLIRSEVLSPDGFLLIEVPNLFGHCSFEVAHAVCFCKKTLMDALNVSGYSVLTSKVHNIPRTDDPRGRYITVVAKPRSREASRRPVILPVWEPVVQLRRLKGMSRRGWPQLALRAAVKAFGLGRPLARKD